jgi:hypothetical protein
MGDLIIAGLQFAPAGSNEPKTTIFNFEPTAIEPDQAMPIRVRDT